jgi:hypothetical protein
MSKGFQKIAVDKHYTTMKHPDGHELKIAHFGLKPRLLKQLKDMPLRGEKMAEGGQVRRYSQGAMVEGSGDSDDSSSQAPVVINVGTPQSNEDEIKKKLNTFSPFESNYTQPNSEEQIKQMAVEQMANRQKGAYTQDQDARNSALAMNQRLREQGAPPEAMRQVPGDQPEASAGPAPASTDAPPVQDTLAQPQAPAPRAPKPAPAQAAAQNVDQAEAQAQPAVAGAPAAQGADQYQKGVHDYYKENAYDLGQKAAAWQQDLTNGHVDPKTYASMFAKKDTLGKVGTLFGLLFSSIGSGLTHQPDALLEMMNNEIKNDLDAQIKSKENAKNFITLSQQHELNESTIKYQGAQAANANAEAQTKGFALAQVRANMTAAHHLSTMVQNMPEGPEKRAAQQAYAMTMNGMGNENSSIMDRAAANLALVQAGNSGDGINTAALKTNPNMVNYANDIEQKTVPGAGMSSIPVTPEIRSQISSGIAFQNELSRFIDWTSKHSGSLSPADIREGQALSGQLNNAFRNATHGGVYKEGENGFIGKMIDPNPTKFLNNIRVMPKLKAVQRESAAQLDQTMKSAGLKNGYQPQGNDSGTVRVMDNQGKLYTMPKANLQKALSRGFKVAE